MWDGFFTRAVERLAWAAPTLHCDAGPAASATATVSSPAAEGETPAPAGPAADAPTTAVSTESSSAGGEDEAARLRPATQARQQRQQQQQQEEEMQQLRRLVVSSQGRKVRVNEVRVEGVRHTRTALVQAVVAPLLAGRDDAARETGAAAAAETAAAPGGGSGVAGGSGDDGSLLALGELLERTRAAGARLVRLGIFKKVEVGLDAAAVPPADSLVGREAALRARAEGVGRDGVDVVFTVEELPRLWGQTGTSVGNNEGSMFTALRLRNVFGGAETLEANVSYGVETTSLPAFEGEPATSSTTAASPAAGLSALGSNQSTTAFEAAFARPVGADPDVRAELRASKFHRNLALYSAHSEAVTGIAARFKLLNTIIGDHELGYDLSWRHVFGLAKDASFTVRRDAGHSLKSALSYSLCLDRRDDALLPTSGHFFKGFLELAGIGGDVLHAKGEVDGQVHVPLARGFSASASARSGLVFPLAPDRPNRILDRFYVGGPLSVRGFQQHGIGPKDGADRVGGDLYVTGGVSVFAPLPYLVDAPIKAHLFANAGNLIQLDQESTRIVESARRLFGTISSSVGLGLAVRFSMLRLEVNYCLPVTATTADAIKPGLQFGVGLHFS
ncbi:hypothetical protein HK405_006298 [Cladochytrium tenue]|nr:hypothetical protein HK405_006298 [Cladochytrium tenue]